MKTLYGVWIKRPTRKDQREKTWLWGWLRRKDDQFQTNHYTADPKDGFETHKEAEDFAFMFVAKNPDLIGWLEIRLFYPGPFVSP